MTKRQFYVITKNSHVYVIITKNSHVYVIITENLSCHKYHPPLYSIKNIPNKDCFGSALNESAIATEQFIIADSNADFDFRSITVLREQSSLMLLEFINRCSHQKNLLKFTREYCLFLLEHLQFQWTPVLRGVFQKLWSILIREKEVDLMVSDDVAFSMMKMDVTDVVNLVYD